MRPVQLTVGDELNPLLFVEPETSKVQMGTVARPVSLTVRDKAALQQEKRCCSEYLSRTSHVTAYSCSRDYPQGGCSCKGHDSSPASVQRKAVCSPFVFALP